MNAKDALKSYRQTHATGGMADALTSFNALSEAERFELLFWIIMHTNHQIAPILEKLGIKYTVNKPPAADN